MPLQFLNNFRVKASERWLSVNLDSCFNFNTRFSCLDFDENISGILSFCRTHGIACNTSVHSIITQCCIGDSELNTNSISTRCNKRSLQKFTSKCSCLWKESIIQNKLTEDLIWTLIQCLMNVRWTSKQRCVLTGTSVINFEISKQHLWKSQIIISLC